MKGISEVIAIILILMIVIALAALAYTWFSGIFSQLTQTAGTSVTQTQQSMQSRFKIEATYCDARPGASATACSDATDFVVFTLRNLGTQRINVTQVSAYIDGSWENLTNSVASPITITYSPQPACSVTSFDQGCTATWNKTNPNIKPACPGGTSVLRVSLGTGLADSRSINCVV